MGVKKKGPSRPVLAERIRALDKRVDQRFIGNEERIKERFEAVALALKLAANGHLNSLTTWLSLISIGISILTLALLFIRSHG